MRKTISTRVVGGCVDSHRSVLRTRMRDVVDAASPSIDLTELRDETRDGDSLSTIVEEDREERV